MKPLVREKIGKTLWEVAQTVHRERHVISSFKYFPGDCAGAEAPEFMDSGWRDFKLGDAWGGYDRVAWFRATLAVPAHLVGKKLALRFLVGPRDGGDSTAETLLYLNGKPLQAIDVWHEEAWLPPEVAQGTLHIALRAWSGVLGVPEQRRFKVAELVWVDERAERYFHVADTLRRALHELSEEDWRFVKLLGALHESVNLVDFNEPKSERYYASLDRAGDLLQERLEHWRTLEPEKPTVVGVGHAHIDLAWLWRLSHSREKAVRTFTTVLHLMRQYPEYRFLHSSPQLYKFVETDAPELFEQVKARVAEGRWEATGGMWVEPDTNVPSGESLVRQLLFGQRYFRKTFGRPSKLLWLPDVFGYSWSLPQLLKKSGVEYFLTSKISWSQFNRFPHDTFRWRGIDGSEVLTHFITTPEEGSSFYTYNGQLSPRDVKGSWDAYRQKEVNDELLTAFGWGDGGGGPTREMLESARVLKNLPGFPRVELGRAEPFFERLAARLKPEDLPVWDGELYLEYHRGTYTSQAQTKRDNRKAEWLYHEAEWLGGLASILTGQDVYPDLREGWERLLLNQFHDILPGSSIRQVYEDSAADFARIFELGEAALAGAQAALLGEVGLEQGSVVVLNGLALERGGLVALPLEGLNGKSLAGEEGEPLPCQEVGSGEDKRLLVSVPEVPSLGYRAFPIVERGGDTASPLELSPRRLDTPFYRLELSEEGRITSLFDKRHGREVVAPGQAGNALQAFEDKPIAFDAWDIDIYYQDKRTEVTELLEAVVEERGPLRGVLRLTWRFFRSTITQRLTVYARSPRLDFVTEVDWQQEQTLLKVAFPTTVRATRATYDIQFGAIERPTHWNTSWDWARFEVPAHKWADLSEGNFGVALMNDCKYGYDVRDNVLRLTLIKSAIRPDAEADKGRHRFTYSLLPHAGDWRGEVIPQAYDLNLPLRASVRPAQAGRLEPQHGFAAAEQDNVIIDTLKRAEDGDGWILRVFEAKQCRGLCSLTFGRPLARALECDLLEEHPRPAEFAGKRLSFHLSPYEVKTFRLHFAPR